MAGLPSSPRTPVPPLGRTRRGRDDPPPRHGAEMPLGCVACPRPRRRRDRASRLIEPGSTRCPTSPARPHRRAGSLGSGRDLRTQQGRPAGGVGAGGSFYDLVYRATASRAVLQGDSQPGRRPGRAIRVRRDTRWCVPEPELALVLSPDLAGRLHGRQRRRAHATSRGKTRSICRRPRSMTPVVPWARSSRSRVDADLASMTIRLGIERRASRLRGTTSLAGWPDVRELIGWLGIDNTFPDGVVLLTGTGIVPPDEFSLAAGRHRLHHHRRDRQVDESGSSRTRDPERCCEPATADVPIRKRRP